MTVLTELLESSKLDSEAIDHIQLLLAEWQILADLSFADLVLFVHHELMDGRPGYLCVGQMRPYTAQTIYLDDLVGMEFTVLDRPMVARAFSEGRVIRDADPDWSTGVPVREEAIPVRFRDEVIAVVTREANVATARSPSQLELTYLQAAGQLARMLAEGLFPYPQAGLAEERELAPRVGDGIAKLDGDGVVTYASPNAISAYRRMGHLDQVIGVALTDVDPVPGDVTLAYEEQAPITGELELEGATVIRRVMPLLDEGVVTGALVLVREVTELRRHQRALRIKDATIREIHHRVKNNLQTVASLLRLQTRRLASPEAKSALEESVRRISSIAMVHEALSQESGQKVSFEVIANRVVDLLHDSIVDPDTPVAIEVHGSPGDLPAEVATPLALVLSELVQNCVEHAFPHRGGNVEVLFDRSAQILRVVVTDDGVGLPPGRSLDEVANLGLQIARTLISSELGGTFESMPVQQGTSIQLVIPLP